MLRVVRTLALGAALAALVSCATTSAYQRAAEPGGYGYSETDIDSARVRVTFRGNTLMSQQRVQDMLLYRAADLTLARGFDYFTLADRSGAAHSQLQSYDGPNYGRFYTRRWNYPSGSGWVSWYHPGLKADVSYRQITAFEASAEVVLHHGAKPADDPGAFDAREVEARLRAIAAP